ncbi:MAG: ATP-dependent helicase rep [Anaerocolumna sp.]|nr:ATP-dependent helicase rep [Anaerocolumna sp.]
MGELMNQVNNMKDNLSEWQKEEKQLEFCVGIIQNNIDNLTQELKEISAETKELYDNYRSNNPELHNDLVMGLNQQSMIERTLKKNLLAINKPYFGRIDYMEKGENINFALYIGKNGISKTSTEMIIIDWRAPVSSVYYDSDIGESSYKSPFGETIDISLELKRTYEISEQKLVDYYDSDVIASDEFLTKYLSKNKEVVLGEIIATIQKEQNDIIRDTPFHNVIVQGVAGSGKTTVAMHRISYILYNYKDRFRSEEFFIIGSNKMLLNYITGVLPNLDVYNINQITMEEFFLEHLSKDFSLKATSSKKRGFTLTNSFKKLSDIKQTVEITTLKRFKGSMHFIKALEYYLDQYELDTIPTASIIYNGKEVYPSNDIKDFLSIFKEKSLQEKIELLNMRLTSKIRLENERQQQEIEIIREELKKYKNYFGKKNAKTNIVDVYKDFLKHLLENQNFYLARNVIIPEYQIIQLLITNFDNKIIDLYDLAMLTYIKRRVKFTDEFQDVSHIVIDEAQDFGVLIYYVLKNLFKDCTYTIMGDITQNIHYDTGMNDWESLKEDVFLPEKDKFYILAKSYRNTVEISEYASKVLKHCTFKTYEIEPIIRHGKDVGIKQCKDEMEMLQNTIKIIENNKKDGYTTIAVICRTIEETVKVQELLSNYMTIQKLEEDMEEMTFTNGVMVLPIHMTKGLEFDAVLLWNPDEIRYEESDADAKLLYVAITRALHELNVIYQGNLSKLLK